MKFHSYSLFDENLNMDLYIKSLNILNALDDKYKTNNFSYQSSKLMQILKYGDVKGKRVLDLGCGTINSPDSIFLKRSFEPWFARALSHMGADIVGIDKYAGGQETLFVEHKIDLSEENSLDFLKDKSIDIACMNSLLDAPSLKTLPKKFMNIIAPQLERIVKNDGIFIYESFGL